MAENWKHSENFSHSPYRRKKEKERPFAFVIVTNLKIKTSGRPALKILLTDQTSAVLQSLI